MAHSSLLVRVTRLGRGLIAGLAAALLLLSLLPPWGADRVQETLMLFLVATPFLVWTTLEPEPREGVADGKPSRAPLWLRFPFQPGGASGVAYFSLLFAGVFVANVARWLVFWAMGHNPSRVPLTQLSFCWAYASLFVLVPVGLFPALLRTGGGRVVAMVMSLLSLPLLAHMLPTGGPREPWTLTEMGDPADMIRTAVDPHWVVHYARDDAALLYLLGALGIVLHVGRVRRRYGELAAHEASFGSGVHRGGEPEPADARGELLEPSRG